MTLFSKSGFCPLTLPPTPCMQTFAAVVMRSPAKSSSCLSTALSCGLPKRQSPTQRRPITASVGYSPSQNPSAAWPVVFFGGHRTASSISLLRQLRNERHSCGRVSAGVSIPVRSDFNARGCGQTRRPGRTPAPDRIVGNRLLAGQAPVVSRPGLAAVPASRRKRLPVRWRESRALL